MDSQQRGSPAWGLGGGETTHHNNLYGIKCLTKPWTWDGLFGMARTYWIGLAQDRIHVNMVMNLQVP